MGVRISEMIVKYVLKTSMAKAERCFEKLHDSMGRESFLGRAFNEQEVTEAWLRCTSEYQGPQGDRQMRWY